MSHSEVTVHVRAGLGLMGVQGPVPLGPAAMLVRSRALERSACLA